MIGKVVSQYRITEYIGSGAMGEVYKAEHLQLDLTVAIKFIPESFLADERTKKQFMRGVQALASLEHLNICRFYEVGETPEGRIFVVMSFCEGATLHAKLERGRYAVKEALEIARDIAAGLAHAHKRKVVHQDIKPANLMFDKEGVVKIVDFGLAKLIDQSKFSSSGASGGTLLYMSPEQLNGDRVDGRADIFGLGDVLYEMVTGTHPFYAERPQTVVYRILNDFPKPLLEVQPDASQSLEQVVNRALQKDPQARYQTAEEMRVDLQAVIDGKELVPPKPRASWVKRIVVAAAIAVVAAIGGYLLWPYLFPSSIGVAVYAAEPDVGSAEERALVDGFARDLTDRIRVFARRNAEFWVVEPDWVERADLRGPEKARGLLGANLAVAVRASPMSDHPGVEVQSYNVTSSAVPKEKLQIDLSEGFSSDRVDASLKQLIGAKSGSASGGYTTNSAAYRNYLIGLGHLDAGTAGVGRAISALEGAVATDSTFARAWAALGEGYRVQFDATKDAAWAGKSVSACRRALAQFSELPYAFTTIGKLQAARNQSAEAVHAFQAALAIDPRHNQAHWQLADIHSRAGRANDAETAYATAVEANPDDPSALVWLGYFYYVNERYRDAIAPLERVSRLTPLSGQNYNMLGACYFALDCWEQALEMFKRSFDLERNYVACSNLGILYYMNHRFLDAAQMYEWAREYSPQSWEVVGYLAASRYWIPGERERAIALYREGTEMAEERRTAAPNDARLLALLAGFYAITNRDSVSSVAEGAITLMPNDADVRYRAALAYDVAGDRERALTHLARSIDLGHSIRQIETEPFLDELRKDPRYELLTRDLDRKDGACDVEI